MGRVLRRPFRIEGYAIACLDGAIADATGLMPDSLKLEADQRFFEKALDRAAVVVHGRMSHEGQPNSPKRRRLILTRRVNALAPDPDNANARFWNPAGASLEEGCAAVGCRAAGSRFSAVRRPTVTFLKIGYDSFYLSRAPGFVCGVACRSSPKAGLAARPKRSSSALVEAGKLSARRGCVACRVDRLRLSAGARSSSRTRLKPIASGAPVGSSSRP